VSSPDPTGAAGPEVAGGAGLNRPMAVTGPQDGAEAHGRLALFIGAVGIVYGDIGTSPLYALRECFHPMHGVAATHDNVLGILSLFFWALTLVVTVKYLTFIMLADNHGEGGTLALLSLVLSRGASGPALIGAGLFGAALLCSEGMITPAISVLSSVEGVSCRPTWCRRAA
jgi:KUP system potassium uptake protein